MKKFVHVAVGVIFDSSDNKGKILIAKRAEHQHQGGLWEFPGGKVEPGESIQIALQRELEEELGLQSSIEDMYPLITIPFHYPDKSVLLDVWTVHNAKDFKQAISEESKGKGFFGKEGQPLLWVEPAELADYEFPVANKAIIDALTLPRKIVISQDSNNPEIILRQIANTLKNHTDIWINLRAPSLDQMEYTQLAMQLYGICHEAGSQLIWNCPLDWYQVAFADGLHLSVANYMEINPAKVENVERPIPTHQWLSMACHNLPELEVAQELADYVLVSPVHETNTHPQANALTWSGFKVITDKARIPCYALGGMKESEVEPCLQSGGQGIAGISCFLAEPLIIEGQQVIEAKNIKESECENES